MLIIRNLQVQLKNMHLLENINLECKENELNVIIGPNGAGKSTLLKTIANIISPNSGSITLNNNPIDPTQIAYMAQFNQNSNLQVIDVLELSRRKHSGMILSQHDYDLIHTSINEFSLENFLHRNIDTLSGGEKQKIYLTAALLQEPKILLLDEPISFLDPKNQIEILEIIKRKTHEKNLITLAVLHDLQSTLHYANKVIMLKNKNLIDFAPTQDITQEMISKLYDIPCKIFWQDGHPFSFFGHTHNHNHIHTHNHKGIS